MLRFVAIKRWLYLIPLMLFCLSAVASPVIAAEAVVTDMRVGMHDSKTRLVFDLSNQVRFGVFTLADPYRIVIDLPEVGWRLPARPLPRRTGILQRLRYGLFKAGVSRVVLDINGPAVVANAFLLQPSGTNGYRIVIDLQQTSRQNFIKSTQGVGVIVTAPRRLASGMLQVPPSVLRVPAVNVLPPAITPFSPPPRKPSRHGSRRIVVIDPGHGGVDPGTTGISGVYEKTITLAAAREIKRKLEATGRFSVVLTRNRDIFVQLRDRVAISREAGAELFISIHADAIKNRKIRGLSVYTLSEKASDREAAALADKENKADIIAGVDFNGESREVTNILIDLAQRESMNQSARFASDLVKELRQSTRVLRNTHRFAGFAVLKAPDVPSVLLELGFLSNRQDERALRSKKYRARMAAALTRAVEGYFTNVEEASRR